MVKELAKITAKNSGLECERTSKGTPEHFTNSLVSSTLTSAFYIVFPWVIGMKGLSSRLNVIAILRRVSDGYKLGFWLDNYTVVSPMNSGGSLHKSLSW